MHNKRLLTLDDLYSYYVGQGKNYHFDSNEDHRNIVVQVPSTLRFQKSEKDTEGLMPVTLWSCHIDENLNGSSIPKKSMQSALQSFANRPILGYIHTVDDRPEFYTHNMYQDEEGEIVYQEYPVGVIPESGKPHFEENEENGKTYVVVDGYIFEEYSKAAEILRRREECPCSVELSIRELSYDAGDKLLQIDDFWFSGVTILGFDEDGNPVKPGMSGAHISISDFSAENNSVFSNNKLIESLEKLSEQLANFNINHPANSGDSKEGGNNQVRFNELLEKYGKTVEDITFEYENLSDEELEEAFKTAFDGDPEPSEETPEEPSEPTDAEVAAGVEALINAIPVTVATTDEEQIVAAREAYDALTDAQKALITEEVLAILTGAEASLGEAKAAAANQTAADAVTTAINALTTADNVTLDDAEAIQSARRAYDSLTAAQKELIESTVLEKLTTAEEALNEVRATQDEDVAPKKKKRNNELTYTVEIDGEVKTFSVSLIDKLNALSTLVNNTYSETDDAWYDVDAYDEEKYVIMHDYWRNKHYRQSYAVKKDVYSLKGDRVEVFARYLTNDEISKLESMKTDYAVISEKLDKYEKEPEKVAILESEDYANIVDVEEFVELKKQENHFDLSVQEVTDKANEILLNYAKHNTIKFAENEKLINTKKLPGSKKTKSSRYGNLFSKR